jgi:hypothetical protein
MRARDDTGRARVAAPANRRSNRKARGRPRGWRRRDETAPWPKMTQGGRWRSDILNSRLHRPKDRWRRGGPSVAGKDANVRRVGPGRLVRLAAIIRRQQQRAVPRADDDHVRIAHPGDHEAGRDDNLQDKGKDREQRGEFLPDRGRPGPNHDRSTITLRSPAIPRVGRDEISPPYKALAGQPTW